MAGGLFVPFFRAQQIFGIHLKNLLQKPLTTEKEVTCVLSVSLVLV